MILALDISARNTGWCVGFADGEKTITGSFGFSGRKDDLGRLSTEFLAALKEIVRAYEPTLVCIEEPIRPSMKANLLALRQLYGLSMVAEMLCYKAGISVCEAHNRSHKKIIYGHGGKKPLEAVAIEKAKHWGFNPSNHDEADACGVWLMTVREVYPDEFKRLEVLKSERVAQAGMSLI